MTHRFLFAALLSALFLGRSARADGSVTMDVVPSSSSIAPGEPFQLAIVLSIEPGWHVYWLDSGAAGLATSVTVEAPPGFVVKPARFARPRAFKEPEGTVFGYLGEAVLVVPIEAPAALPTGNAHFKVTASWLSCRESCVLGSGEKSIDVATTTAAARAPSSDRFASFLKRLPAPLAGLEGFRADTDGKKLRVTGSAAGFATSEVFPVEIPGVTYGRSECVVHDGRFEASVEVKLSAKNADGRPLVLRGVITLGDKPDDPSYEYEIPVPLDAIASERE